MKDCIFCKIINKQLPSYQLYEDELFSVILDINPMSKGHCLVITKQHSTNLEDLPSDESAKVLDVAKKIMKSIKQTFNPAGFNILQNNGSAAGQIVMHYHLHIIPRYEDKAGSIRKIYENNGSSLKYTPQQFNKICEEIKMNIK